MENLLPKHTSEGRPRRKSNHDTNAVGRDGSSRNSSANLVGIVATRNAVRRCRVRQEPHGAPRYNNQSDILSHKTDHGKRMKPTTTMTHNDDCATKVKAVTRKVYGSDAFNDDKGEANDSHANQSRRQSSKQKDTVQVQVENSNNVIVPQRSREVFELPKKRSQPIGNHDDDDVDDAHDNQSTYHDKAVRYEASMDETSNDVICGEDVVIYQYQRYGTMIPNMVSTRFRKRMTLEQLQEEFPSPFHFIWNKNVKDLPKRLRGLLCYTRNAVWCIVEALDDRAVAIKRLPEGGNHEPVVLNLWELGYPVQQVSGKPIGIMKLPRTIPSPTEGRFVQMDPLGPDVIVLLPKHDKNKARRIANKLSSKAKPFLMHDTSLENHPLPDEVPVVYVLDKPELRKSVGIGQEKKFCVPLWSTAEPREGNR